MADDDSDPVYSELPTNPPPSMSFKEWQDYWDKCQYRGAGFEQAPFTGKIE